MKKKNPDNELVTKGFLKSHLRGELTLFKSEFKEEIKQQLTKFRSKILDAVDAVMKEVVAMREEQTIHFHQHERINENLEDHEERIKDIEGHKFA